MTEDIAYREMKPGEELEVCNLANNVFNQYVAPDYDQEGIDEFVRFANPNAMKERTQENGFVFVAHQGYKLVGMIEFFPPNVVAMLFVTLQHHGIAKELLAKLITKANEINQGVKKLVVHSSPYAEAVYEKMGFFKVGELTKENGIIYIPMERLLIEPNE